MSYLASLGQEQLPTQVEPEKTKTPSIRDPQELALGLEPDNYGTNPLDPKPQNTPINKKTRR